MLYAALAIALWAAPGLVDGGPMAVRYLGPWAAFLAIGAGWAAARPQGEAARLSVIALGAFPLAAIGGAIAA